MYSTSPTNLSQARMHRVEHVFASIFCRDSYILARKTAFTYCGADVLFIFVDYSTRWINRQPAGDKNSKVRNIFTCGGINVRETCIRRLLDNLGHVLKQGGKSVDKTGLLVFPLNFEPVPKARTGIRLPSLRGMAGIDIININSTNYGARTQ
jgi:hypothetical protein